MTLDFPALSWYLSWPTFIVHAQLSYTDTIIERKTLNDIMSSSASLADKSKGKGQSQDSKIKEARHFKQERQLRNCGARHPMILIEVDKAMSQVIVE